MLRISSGLASLYAQHAFARTESKTAAALKELSSGSRFSSAGTDPAGLAISEQLRAQTKGYEAALKNTENASSFVQVAEGALNEQNNIIIRLRELAVQAASDTLGDTEREFLNDEFTQLVEEFDRIAKSTKFGKQSLLDGSTKEYEFQVGVNKGDENVIAYTSDTDTTASAMGLQGLGVSDKGDARDSLESLDEAMTTMGAARAKLGAIQSRLDTSVSHLQTQVENISEATSKIADADIPDAISRVRRGQILAQYQAMAMREANTSMESVLRLIA